MKFSSSLRFNAVAEWWDEYIAYDALKKYIYQIEKQQHAAIQPYHDIETGHDERASLLAPNGEFQSKSDSKFKALLDREIVKISSFYFMQEKELLQSVNELEQMVLEQDEAGFSPEDRRFMDDDDDDDDGSDEDYGNVEMQRSHSMSRERTWPTKRSRKHSNTVRAPIPGNMMLSVEATSQDDHSTDPMATSRSSIQRPALSVNFPSQNRTPKVSNSSHISPINTVRSLANRLPFMRRDSLTSTSPTDGPMNVWTSKSNYAWDMRLLYKRKITTLFISISNLKSYVEMNYSGFRKILKKYDKVTYSELKNAYIHQTIDTAMPFTEQSKSTLNAAILRLETLYTKCVTRGDHAQALQQLKLNQRENIAWERDTIWRQMIGRARRGASGVDSEEDIGALGGAVLLVPDKSNGIWSYYSPLGRFKLTGKKISLTIAVTVLAVLLNVQTLDSPAANSCFAVLVFSTIMWATEAIPLFVTSLLVPLLLVCTRAISSADNSERLSTPEATKYIFSVMFSPTIMLLIGGFTISSALSKTNIDRVIITRVLSLAGTRPSTVLLAFMGVSCFASMWISNVAAPTLCFTLIRPILRTLPPKASFAPALILAIALAANIGGQSSPISSPQNLIALAAMDPPISWSSWFTVALPVSFISIILIWLLIVVSYRPSRSPTGDGNIEIKSIRPTQEPFTIKQHWVVFVCVVTIGLWCVEHQIHEYVGDMGIIALIPVVAFFGTGVLKKDDFENFAWTIVFLAMGGIALGKGVTSSGLLEIMDEYIRELVQGLSLYTVVLVLSPVVLIISTFISHTIASVLLVPIAKEVGSNLPGNHSNLLIFITGLICSAGMGMPVSGFPNQTAATQQDDLGQFYLSNIDFLKNGVPASIIATLIVATIGFLLMKVIGL